MGWTGYRANYYKNGKIDRKKECDAYFLEGYNRGYYEILKSVMVGSIYYAAIRAVMKKIGGELVKIPQKEQHTFAIVMLTRIKGMDFYYKEMTEDMEPFYYDCPESILNLLSDTTNKNAVQWRETCRKKVARNKFLNVCPVGTIIRIKHNGDILSLIKESPRYQFRTPWWRCLEVDTFIRKKHIPAEFEALPEIQYPVVGIIYNYKGLSETNYLCSLKELKQKDKSLYEVFADYSGMEQPVEDGYAYAANKTSCGILLRDKEELKEFLEFRHNAVAFHENQNEDWYCQLSSDDFYGSQEKSKVMERAFLDFKIKPENRKSCTSIGIKGETNYDI